MLFVMFAMFSLHRELPDMILRDEPLLSQGGSVAVGYQSKIGVKHRLKHLKITTTLSLGGKLTYFFICLYRIASLKV
jgi:hypothetical protein